MKKILSAILLVALLLTSVAALASCGGSKLKMGLGVYTATPTATDATADTAGSGKVAITVAAVLVDGSGKIVKCVIDTAENTVSYTNDGKAVAATEFKTKYEKGDDYNMVEYGGSEKEWYQQVDAFCALTVGKTADEVMALVVNDDKGTDEVISAGCTITVSEFAKAVKKAVENATDSQATKNSELKLGVDTEQANKDATADAAGSSQLDTTVFAAAVGSDGKIVDCATECVRVKFTFDVEGKSTFDTTKEIKGKRELGTGYGMSEYGQDLNGDGTVKEWFEQADAFEAACVGKTADKVEELLASDGYGVESLQTAGCTIAIGGLVRAAAKLAD